MPKHDPFLTITKWVLCLNITTCCCWTETKWFQNVRFIITYTYNILEGCRNMHCQHLFWWLCCSEMKCRAGYRQYEEAILSSQSSFIYCFLSHQKAFFMLIELKEQPCVQRSVSVRLWNARVCVCVCGFEQWPQTCSSRLDILFTEPTHWQSFLHRERHTPKHIRTSLPGSTVKLIYLSIAPPVCLSSNPFHHSVILLSVCFHSSVIIRQKKM